jgi:hypothetical protein
MPVKTPVATKRCDLLLSVATLPQVSEEGEDETVGEVAPSPPIDPTRTSPANDPLPPRRQRVRTGPTRGPPGDLDDLLTPAELAEWFRCSESGLAKMRLRGDGPRFTKVGAAVRYRRRDVIHFLDLKATTSTSAPECEKAPIA